MLNKIGHYMLGLTAMITIVAILCAIVYGLLYGVYLLTTKFFGIAGWNGIGLLIVIMVFTIFLGDAPREFGQAIMDSRKK